MTPAARVQAAIEILDAILGGDPAERALTRWARSSRYAGSKDRAAVRDHVFDVLRRRRSSAALGGAGTGRGLMLGLLRGDGVDPGEVFGATPHAPPPLSDAERAAGRAPDPGAEALDLPDWLWAVFQDSLGETAEGAAEALRHRAPVHLRVNLARTDVAEAQAALARDGIETRPHPASATALEVTGGARRIRGSDVYTGGLVDLQDAGSQAVVEVLPLEPGMRVLDYCAGGGGKTLAMAARTELELAAHDAVPRRMSDLPARAARAGATVEILETIDPQRRFDLVLCDVPCSGSGSWRRDPEGKWRLTPDELDRLGTVQSEILDTAAALVAPGGILAYATCSVLRQENEAQVRAFSGRWPGARMTAERRWTLTDGTDGFYSAHLTLRKAEATL